MLYESLQSYPGVAHLNYLLRQQSENAYLKSENRWTLRFWRVFLDFLIFSFLDGFGVVSAWISIPRRHFLPVDGSRSLRAWNFTKNRNFINNVTGRNKIHQNINFWLSMNSSFRLPPELSLCMCSSFHFSCPGKLSNCKTNLRTFHTL